MGFMREKLMSPSAKRLGRRKPPTQSQYHRNGAASVRETLFNAGEITSTLDGKNTCPSEKPLTTRGYSEAVVYLHFLGSIGRTAALKRGLEMLARSKWLADGCE